tara:strand:- start:1021 stop:2778 length:1758 start_codon:yes stop_codon:yes gene_type:complete
MFYETLEKLAEEKKKKKKKFSVGAAAGSGALVFVGPGNFAGMNMIDLGGTTMRKELKKDKGKGYKQLLSSMGHQKGDQITFGDASPAVLSGGHFKDKHGKKIFFSDDLTDTMSKTLLRKKLEKMPESAKKKHLKRLSQMYDNNAAFLNKHIFNMADTKEMDEYARGGIAMGKKMKDADILLHELGHATGTGAKVMNSLPGALAYGLTTGPVGSIASIGGNLRASYKSLSADDKKSLDDAEKANKRALQISAIHKVPQLAEEARASIRAVGLGKKFGHNVNKKKLLGAYGTYGGLALAHLSPYLVNKAIINRKRKNLEKKASQSEGTESDYTRKGLRAAGSLAGAELARRGVREVAKAGWKKSKDSYLNSLTKDTDDYHNLVKNIGVSTGADGKYFTGKGGKKILFTDTHQNSNKASFRSILGKENVRGAVILGKNKTDPDTLLHELGHATGTGRKILNNKAALKLYSASKGNTARNVSRYGNLAATAGALYAKDDESLDKAEKANRVGLALGAFHKAPQLAEEARASTRAIGLGKKFGHNVNKSKLLKAYGTYAAAAVPHLAPYLINKAIINRKRKNLENKKGNS